MTQNEMYHASAEVAIVGAGPIGLELAVALKEANITTLHFEAQQIGYTISWWPRNTDFFSTSERIAICGVPIQNISQGRTKGEEYLAYLRAIVEQFDLQINSYEKVTVIKPTTDGFTLRTQTATGEKVYHSQRVVLAKGDMDRPNCLNIPGEDLPHVSHYFVEPHRYFRKRLLVVGGKNSAVEAALRCWRSGAKVAVSYRRADFSDRVKDHIRPDIKAQIEKGNIEFFPETVPVEITPQNVILKPAQDGELTDGPAIVQPADFVLLCTGFEADMSLFEIAGIKLSGPVRQPEFDPETMETNVPGLYLAGTAAAGMRQKKYRLFIENSHEHVEKIVLAITGRYPTKIGTIPARQYSLSLEEIKAN